MGRKLILAEKPAVARDLARVLGVPQSGGGGAFESNDWVITWCIGHLIELEEPAAYRPEWQRWSAAGLGLVAGLAVFLASPPGRRAWQFTLDSRIELRKVVWPNRQETLQTTAVVLGFLVIAGLFFWFLDLGLAWLTRLATGQGG